MTFEVGKGLISQVTDQATNSLKRVVVNNLISTVINFAVILIVVAIILAVDALTGVGMGLEILLAPIALGVYTYLGNKLLTPTKKHLWTSVIGSPVVVFTAFLLAYLHTSIFLDDFLFAALVVALVPPFFMRLGLEIRVQNEKKASKKDET